MYARRDKNKKDTVSLMFSDLKKDTIMNKGEEKVPYVWTLGMIRWVNLF